MFKEDIERIFISTNEFAADWKEYLDTLDIEDKGNFILELLDSILTESSYRSIFKNEFGVGTKDSNLLFRYSKLDYETALNTEPLSSERLIKQISEDPHANLKFRATAIFHQRKIREIENEIGEIEKIAERIKKYSRFNDLRNISNRKSFKFEEIDFKFIVLPDFVTKDELNKILESLNFAESFKTTEDFKTFRSNSFKLFTKRDNPILIEIDVGGKRKNLAGKMFELYSKFKDSKLEYPNLDLRKETYAQSLICNIKQYQESKTTDGSFSSQLNIVLGEMRKN